MTDAKSIDLPIARGASSGIAAWVGGYVIVYALTIAAIRSSTLAQLILSLTGDLGEWRIVGWVFYSAHFSPSTVPVLFGGETINLVSTMQDASAVLFAIPPILLFLAGIAVQSGTPPTSSATAAKSGLTVTLGYLPAALAGSIVFTVSTSGVSAGPTPLSAIVVVGIVYPAIFGTIGAVIGNYLRV